MGIELPARRGAQVDFHCDKQNFVRVVCVRDDGGLPFLSLFKLADGRYVTAAEC
ncbi:hypothetical protein [Aeromonas media]|uniref:hypothetical protein n=1 Tax=Aeromonas media TaxID=651 RepID=UPI0022830658|nr:hypothetical protein [Aeromonas media]MCY9835205.1 hypothetical protein [Aeromonas media]